MSCSAPFQIRRGSTTDWTRNKEENSAWKSIKTTFTKHQKVTVEEVKRKSASQSSKESKPDMMDAEPWLIQAVALADALIEEGEGELADKGEFADVEFKVCHFFWSCDRMQHEQKEHWRDAELMCRLTCSIKQQMPLCNIPLKRLASSTVSLPLYLEISRLHHRAYPHLPLEAIQTAQTQYHCSTPPPPPFPPAQPYNPDQRRPDRTRSTCSAHWQLPTSDPTAVIRTPLKRLGQWRLFMQKSHLRPLHSINR